MNLHEYQSKRLFAQYGLPVPMGEVISKLDETKQVVELLGSQFPLVVKAQVHAGGRGKAGGVQFVKTQHELEQVVSGLLGKQLVTYQTDAKGQPINQVLIEAPCAIEKEFYLGALIDRSMQRLVIIASSEGGMDIEEVANTQPEKILTLPIDPLIKLQPYQCRELSFALGLDKAQMKTFYQLLSGLVKLFMACDISLIEINPLVITKTGELLCLDGKVTVDENALYRQAELSTLRDTRQEDPKETEASKWNLNYIALEGNIGCMVNGAGLAMATMDLIKLYGGEPANFLDVGGGATEERVSEAFKIIISDSSVKGIFVNIFGGIVRCDLIAEGIIHAVKEVGLSIPVVVRLEGNRSQEAANKLEASKLNIIAVSSFAQGAEKIVACIKKEVS